jgi:hypothetical protein
MGGWACTYRRNFPARCLHGQGNSRSKSDRFACTNCHSNGKPHADADSNADSYSNSHNVSYCYRYNYSYTYVHTKTYPDAEV